MKLVGEEKEIQALFYELKLADETLAPGFSRTWEQASTTSFRPQRQIRIAFASATVVLVIMFFGIGLWTQNWQKHEPNGGQSISALVPPTTTVMTGSKPTEPTEPAEQPNHSKPKLQKISARRKTPATGIRLAQMQLAARLSTWQSPTTNLMQSPADQVLIALPEFDQSVSELKSFLPDGVR